ncbi:PRC-barrel domain-containing protein [Castellaniella ginsengisoli]|uniref:PRC-barrel domain-containing protein n=1 Tax=Castellaniella ginsengisoli TaxID=546114 RepID=A0AB39EQV7_9BURK
MVHVTNHSAGANIVGSPKADFRGPGPEVMSAETLQGDEVYNPQGDNLGTIEEIMLDVPHGRIAYAVLSRGGVMGIGDKLYAIPWSALVLDTDRKCFVLDVSTERLNQADGFDKDDWPSMADESWARRVHDFYEQAPYW